MASFAFNFSGDDIDPGSVDSAVQDDTTYENSDTAAPSVPVQEHSLGEWLRLLPSHLSYTTTPLTSPSGRTLPLPRRALFDIRAQLMAEDAESLLTSLTNSDLSTNVYEGGFKTWECSLDLASLLLDRGPRKDIDEMSRVAHVVELGAGSALPSLVLFQHVLRGEGGTAFTLADYNADVLRLVTVPNLVLMWALMRGEPEMVGNVEGELEVTAELVARFEEDLRGKGIDIRLLSGPWGQDLLRLMPSTASDMSTLVLAAETIYSPASLESFVRLLQGILKEGPSHKAYVAAKKFYFGVGGSVDALKVACRDSGMMAAEVENSGLPNMDAGIGRAIVEVQMV
ncbi:hypothetical protein CAC42_989 [Sphaceloma murrayae]|uniref:protein-histidine N-methyltransferase n=1 Tax=Sphaceloma murrayae TaxID=2082308 RepID=A0A2K1R2W6_9PEZI|nr:hypothetical protein CAC42_989 [Sphaceloma murrayae]